MKNGEKFKTAEERAKAFGKWCESNHNFGGAGSCLRDSECHTCHFAWLDLEAEEKKPLPLPCPGCGNTDMHVHDEIQDSKVYIVCPNCGYSSPGEVKLESSVRRHNEIARAVMTAKKEGGR